MLEVNKLYKKAIYAPTRSIKAKVRLEVLDVDAFTDNTKAVSNEASISRISQLTNKIRNKSIKPATFEKDYFRLDGSFVIPPKTNEGEDEIGWISEIISDDNGIFTSNPFITFTFSQEHSSGGITIYFDQDTGEYASDFDIDVYDALNNLINHESVIGNTQPRYIFISQLANYKKIEITIKKWCRSYSRAKVVEVDFGIIKEYENDNLINLNILQELDSVSNTLPADELVFSIDNSNREFNILNPQGFYAFLQKGQEVFVEMGVEIENGSYECVQVGKYFLKEWKSDEGALTTTFTSRDVLDSLSDAETENPIVRDINLYDLAVEVLKASNIDNYSVSENLKLINTKAIYQKMSFRSLLQLIANAGMAVAYSDNKGSFVIKQLISADAVISTVSVTDQSTLGDKSQIINKIAEQSMKVATFEKDILKLDGSFTIPEQDMSGNELGWWSEVLCDSNGVFQIPPKIEINMTKDHTSINFEIIFDELLGEYATEMIIKAFDLSNVEKINETVTNTGTHFVYENTNLQSSRKIEIYINKWSKPVRRARVIEIGFDIPVDSLTFDNIYKEPQIALEGTIKTVEVLYYPTDLESSVVYTLINPNVREGKTIRLENSLINSADHAAQVANWLMKELTKVATFKVDWRQNPALTLGDKVSIQNGYGSSNIAHITRQEIEYQGYLAGKTEAKGVI